MLRFFLEVELGFMSRTDSFIRFVFSESRNLIQGMQLEI